MSSKNEVFISFPLMKMALKKKMHRKTKEKYEKAWLLSKDGEVKTQELRDELSVEYDMDELWLSLASKSQMEVVSMDLPLIQTLDDFQIDSHPLLFVLQDIANELKNINDSIKNISIPVTEWEENEELHSIVDRLSSYSKEASNIIKIKRQIMYEENWAYKMYGKYNTEKEAETKAKEMWFSNYKIQAMSSI